MKECGQIRERIGSNSEKPLNNPALSWKTRRLRTSRRQLYSSGSDREGPEKLKDFFSPHSLLSPFSCSGPWREPRENRQDSKEKRDDHNESRKKDNSVVDRDNDGSHNRISLTWGGAWEKMLRRIGSIAVKFKNVVDAGKRAIQMTSMETARTAQNAVRVFKVMIFLHSAKDFPSVLRLYGMEDSSGNWTRKSRVGKLSSQSKMIMPGSHNALSVAFGRQHTWIVVWAQCS